mgnify:CR=1 FL=1
MIGQCLVEDLGGEAGSLELSNDGIDRESLLDRWTHRGLHREIDDQQQPAPPERAKKLPGIGLPFIDVVPGVDHQDAIGGAAFEAGIVGRDAARLEVAQAPFIGSLFEPSDGLRSDVEAEHATEGVFRQTGPVWAGTTKPDGPYPVRDGAVTDTADLLAEAGYDPAAIDELLQNGVIA